MVANWRRAVARHPAATGFVGLVGAMILIRASTQGELTRAVVYLGAVITSLAIIDVVLRWRPLVAELVPVRQPRLELAVAAAMYIIAFGWLMQRLVLEYQPPKGLPRILWVVIGLGSVFNIMLAIFLLTRRYRLDDLGLRVSGLWTVPPVIALFAGAALVWGRAHITWGEIVADTGGSAITIVGLALSAAVPEEFFRLVWQTRVEAWLASGATGWLVASVLWATLHAPNDYAQAHSAIGAAIGVIQKIPLGLLWGYLTRRTGSILPSIFLHATNVWGLQNLA